jgi:hypothetical protein
MKPFRIIDEKISIGERISLAVTQFVGTIAAVLTVVILLPVAFLRTLFTTTRKVIDVDEKMLPFLGSAGQLPSMPPEDGEDWKRAHKEEYGDE